MLDVGVCAEHLIAKHRAFAGLSRDQRRAFVVLVALHDVGKISATFRDVIRHRRRGAYRHWMLSDVLLTRTLDPILEQGLGGDIHARGELYAAVSGHHGWSRTIERPARDRSSHDGHWSRRRGCRADLDIRFARTASRWVPLEGLDQHAARRLSWALSGLTVAADWGRLEPWSGFPPHPRTSPPWTT